MTYPEAIKYLDSFIDYEKILHYPYTQSFRLERIKEFLNNLNNPQENLKCIHIAGTKGKGSTAAFISYILRQAQFKVGLYTSPHLSSFRERIRILKPIFNHQSQITEADFEGMISEDELTDLLDRLRPYIEKYNSQSRYGALSFFEVYTALAFIYFKEKEVDFAVLETGLGGRLDATNVVHSLIAAIAPISYEHTKHLGRTLTEIAREKAGIIKDSSQLAVDSSELIVITAPQEQEIMGVIRDRCRSENATLYEIGKDITFQRQASYGNPQRFDINGVFGKIPDLNIRLLGGHQVVNATVAAAVVLALDKFYQLRLNLEAVRNGLYNTAWPGRFEIISGEPSVVLDGAQNLVSAQALRDTLVENFPDKRIILVLGFSLDKDIKQICRQLIPIAQEAIFTQADNPRAADVDAIKQIVGSQFTVHSLQISKVKRVKEAILLAKRKAGPEDLIVITGSLFLVGEARELLNTLGISLELNTRMSPGL